MEFARPDSCCIPLITCLPWKSVSKDVVTVRRRLLPQMPPKKDQDLNEPAKCRFPCLPWTSLAKAAGSEDMQIQIFGKRAIHHYDWE